MTTLMRLGRRKHTVRAIRAHAGDTAPTTTMTMLPSAPSTLVEAIYDAYETDADDGRRDHLGASLIGKECERALWYDFRWATRVQFSGRILRLFETGHLEEARLVHDLRRLGPTVLEVDPETGRQWRYETHSGHFAGSLDAVALGLLEAPEVWHLVEFKTHNAKSFATLRRDGVCQAKPLHWAQMQVYMHLAGLDWAIYVAVCKDTDEIHVERVAADHDEGERLLAKAKRIIEAPRPPAGFSTDRESWHCKFCDHYRLCHEEGAAEVSCRTCLHATPVEGGWRCERWCRDLTPTEQRTGCDRHLYIPDLVPGTVLEVGEDWIEYRMGDGTTWRNGKPGTMR